jgi:hypothetical protein
MVKRPGFLLMIGLAILSLSGCAYMRPAGPCYGVGCPTFSSSSQPKVAEVPKAPDANTPSQTVAAADPNTPASPPASSSQPAASQPDAQQQKPGRFTRMLIVLHLHSQS